MTLEAVDGPRVEGRDAFAQEIAVVRGATQLVLEAVRRVREDELDERAVSGLGTRRHVIARLVQHSERNHAMLAEREQPGDGDEILRMPPAALVARLAATLAGLVAALEAEDATAPTYAALVACSEQRAWLELTRGDLQSEHVWIAAGAQLRDAHGRPVEPAA